MFQSNLNTSLNLPQLHQTITFYFQAINKIYKLDQNTIKSQIQYQTVREHNLNNNKQQNETWNILKKKKHNKTQQYLTKTTR